jgi:ABC-type antimicrobial peptide transport system permease subunit
MTRTSLLETLNANYVRTARAKGASEWRVTIRHALRNALIPVVTLIGLQIGFLLGGSVVTETMFAWPGVGRMAVGAITSSDFPLAQGAILILAISFMVVNLLVDVLCRPACHRGVASKECGLAAHPQGSAGGPGGAVPACSRGGRHPRALDRTVRSLCEQHAL